MFDYNQMEYYSLFIIIIFLFYISIVLSILFINIRIINAYYL